MACREQILSEDFGEALIDFRSAGDELDGMDYCVEMIDEQFAVLYFRRSGLVPVSVSKYTYNSIPKLYGLMQEETSAAREYDPVNLIKSGISEVQKPPLSLTGRGVVIGLVDTGIRYNMEVFKKSDGTSRILSIWDQTIQDGTPPEGFSFGTEYTNEQINEAIRNENPLSVVPSTDTDGHGTAVASVAAGSDIGYGTNFLGAAPDADIVMVKCKEAKQYLRDYYLIPEGVPAYCDANIGLAVKYLDRFARVGERPVVICIAMGTNWGDHAGNSVLARYLDRIARKRNRVVVLGGGNEGNAGHHFQRLFPMEGAAVTQTAEIRVGNEEPGFLMELWGTAPNTMSVSIRSPGGEVIPYIDFRSRETRNFSFIYEKTRIAVDHILVEQGGGDELVVFRVVQPTEGVWTFQIEMRGSIGYGYINMWLPISQFLKTDVYFLNSTPYVTLTEPSLADNVITVSAYDAGNNSFYIDSGRGFARGGGLKPDIAAPGVDVSTALGARTGSCMAAAITAGGAAQFMQWAVIEKNDVLAQSMEVKAYFMRGAARSADIIYPNRSWGDYDIIVSSQQGASKIKVFRWFSPNIFSLQKQ